MKLIKVIVVVLLFVGVLTACNTVKGFGEDMQQGGQHLQKAATRK